jgi:hypothetical protein
LLAFERSSSDESAIVVFNFGSGTEALAAPAGTWEDELSGTVSDDQRFEIAPRTAAVFMKRH